MLMLNKQSLKGGLYKILTMEQTTQQTSAQTQTNLSWLDQEAEKLTLPTSYEILPALKLTPNVVVELSIDVSKPFEEWSDRDSTGKTLTTKKIIPVTVNGTKMNWWLNVKNPVYKEIITLLRTGQTSFKVLQTGTLKDTKYVLVK